MDMDDQLTERLVLHEFVCNSFAGESDGGARGGSGSSWERYSTADNVEGATYWKHALTRAVVSYTSLVRGARTNQLQVRQRSSAITVARTLGIALTVRCNCRELLNMLVQVVVR